MIPTLITQLSVLTIERAFTLVTRLMQDLQQTNCATRWILPADLVLKFRVGLVGMKSALLLEAPPATENFQPRRLPMTKTEKYSVRGARGAEKSSGQSTTATNATRGNDSSLFSRRISFKCEAKSIAILSARPVAEIGRDSVVNGSGRGRLVVALVIVG
jgi:hypothetical protein